MEEKYYEILRHHVNPNDCATVVKQLLSLHKVVGQSERLPNMTLEQAIEKAKPNMEINDESS